VTDEGLLDFKRGRESSVQRSTFNQGEPSGAGSIKKFIVGTCCVVVVALKMRKQGTLEDSIFVKTAEAQAP
jgi:hypothetical protein